MKILIVSDAWYPQLNGVVRTYEYLKEELEKMGHSVTVIGPRDFKCRLPMFGYSEIELAAWPFYGMDRRINKMSPDIIHIATEGPLGWAARKYCKQKNINFTSCYHTQFPDYLSKRVSKFLPFLEKPSRDQAVKIIQKFHNRAYAVMVTTKSMADQLKSWGVQAPIQFLTRGIDQEIFYIGQSDVLKDLPKPIALYVGRLAIEKNIKEFLEMDWSGSKVIIGHGPDASMLKKKFPDCHFLGKKTGKELGDYYRASDVFVFPSRTDTFGIVIIEALACGLPVAAHNVMGPKDIITDDFLGCLDEDLSLAAHKALKNDNAQDRHHHVIQNYSWSKAAQQFLNAHKKGYNKTPVNHLKKAS